MAGYGAARATVREALAMLRSERLVERSQGVGTHAVIGPPKTTMDEALGVIGESEMLDAATRPRVLDRSTLPAPDTLAAWLGVDPGTPCLRLEYVAMHRATMPSAIATNYVLYPEAEQLLATPFRGHWYTLLADAGVVLGESEFVMDCVLADPTSPPRCSRPTGAAAARGGTDDRGPRRAAVQRRDHPDPSRPDPVRLAGAARLARTSSERPPRSTTRSPGMSLPENPLTLTAAAAALRAGAITSRALTEAAIAVADRARRAGSAATCTGSTTCALAAADRADAELAAGVDRGPLHGIPFGVKDIIAMAEGPTTAQSLVLDRAWGAGRDAPVVARLKAAGAVITGKTTTMEFAFGMPDPSKPFPIPRNPWDLETWPGGSSSGTGSGVAAGMFLAGLGTDTGGSIRIPAAFCGITGLMPTFGRVPKSGCVPLGYSLDHIGPMARSAADCAAVLEVIAGFHASDPDCVDAPFAASSLDPTDVTDLAGLRIGVVRAGHFPDGRRPGTGRRVRRRGGASSTTLGATLWRSTLPFWTQMLHRRHRHDGLRGAGLPPHRHDAALGRLLRRRPERCWRRARWCPARTTCRRSGCAGSRSSRWAGCSSRSTWWCARRRRSGAPPLAGFLDGTDDVMALFSLIHTGYWDSVGNPVLALPMGETAAGMPLSLQIAGRPFDEATILRAGAAFQNRTDHHLRVPSLALVGAELAA